MIKRIIDILVALIALILLLPVIVVLCIMVKMKLGSPVFFSQERPGLHEKIFKMYKFRSMTDDRDDSGMLLPDAQRLTPFGKFLRSTSLDELPELWNVLKGEMSLVGPRPLRVSYLPLYNSTQRKRHNLRPGITGWAQVNGRNTVSWEDKFDMDVWYVENQSLLLDIKIILKTIAVVLKRDGINQSESTPMQPFRGTNIDK